MIVCLLQYGIPAVSVMLAAWDRHRAALWLFFGGYYGVLALVLQAADPFSVICLALLMMAPLVYSMALVCLIIACEERRRKI